MRLIECKTLELVEFESSQIPEYAILSHRWVGEEVSYAEFVTLSSRSTPNYVSVPGVRFHGGFDEYLPKVTEYIKSKAGYKKISRFCEQALLHGLEYGWVDTCCIDKSSSAELSEAINSMYRWYGDAKECFVYMDDVTLATAFHYKILSPGGFRKSKWHSRGWTLQELLAPADMTFFDMEWKTLGTKTALGHPLSWATGIPTDVLTGARKLRDTSIAQRMSWASKRETTRTEDIAYCLMGIFDVNMPMLYGEGQKAFRRLQEEIMKDSTDQTLFAWTHAPEDPAEAGLLAPHPRRFAHSSKFEDRSRQPGFDGTSYAITKGGVSISLFLDSKATHDAPSVAAILKCTQDGRPDLFAKIGLKQTGQRDNEFVRVSRQNHIGAGHPLSLDGSFIVGTETTVVVLHESLSSTTNALKPFFLILNANFREGVAGYIPGPRHHRGPRHHHRLECDHSVLTRDRPTPRGALTNDGQVEDFTHVLIRGKTFFESSPAQYKYVLPQRGGEREILKFRVKDIKDGLICVSLKHNNVLQWRLESEFPDWQGHKYKTLRGPFLPDDRQLVDDSAWSISMLPPIVRPDRAGMGVLSLETTLFITKLMVVVGSDNL